ncbi:chitinase [Kaistella sp. G5-32]|uniref:Chitinase n=1 Tax=Kaistella gelatinilytica TaxID=2787636 RepID=A0ABS0FAY4_9FLAO|nr:chitinase [Kaistella gelatinilytica]MBF8456869.1 chitinase [Kaistella gelatinilytica]
MKYLFILSLFFFSINCSTKTPMPLHEPLKLTQYKTGETALTLYLNEKKWNELFPNRYGINSKNPQKNAPDFYSFKSFVAAALIYPDFLKGDAETQKRELAAFLANIAQETSGGWAEAPGGYFKWGLYFLEEKQEGVPNDYADFSKVNYPPVAGEKYFGRGPKQLSWNYNYGQFSEAWFGSKDKLLQHPELLSQDPVLSFASAIWFWMTPQFPKPSCHDIMNGNWKPNEKDIQNGRLPGFGATVNVINGGVECGNGTDLQKTKYRYEYYKYFCDYFKVSPGDNISCSTQKPFGQ